MALSIARRTGVSLMPMIFLHVITCAQPVEEMQEISPRDAWEKGILAPPEYPTTS